MSQTSRPTEGQRGSISSALPGNLSGVLAAMSEALLVVDEQWRVAYANAAAAELLDVEAGEGGSSGRRVARLVGTELQQRLAQALEAGGEASVEHWLESRRRWFQVRAVADATHVLLFWRDITAEREARTALAESEYRQQVLSSLTHDYTVSYRVDDDGELQLEWRIGDFAGVVGHRSEDVPGLAQAMRHLHTEDRERFQALLRRLRAGQAIDAAELRMIGADGQVRWIQLSGRPIRDDAGRVVRIVGAVQNVTHRRQVEQVLRDSEQWFRQAMEAMAVGVYVTDAEGRLLRYNQAMGALWGRTPLLHDDAQRYCGAMRIYTADGEFVAHEQCSMAHTVNTGEPVLNAEAVIERPDGTRVTVLANTSPVHDDAGRMIGAVNCVVDITEQRRAQQALRRSEARERERAAELAALMDSVPAVVFLAHDPRGDRITGSRRAHEFLRVPPGQNMSRSAAAGDRPEHFRLFRDGREVPGDQLTVQRACRGEWVHNDELEVRFADGTVRYVVGNACPVLDERGEVRGALAAMIDITERKQAEHALREGERRYRAIFHGAQDPVLVYSVSDTGEPGRFIEVNDAAKRFYGYSDEQFASMTVRDLIVSSQVLENFPAFLEKMCNGEPVLAESVHRAADGREVHVEVRPHLLPINDSWGILSVVRDITHHQQQKDELVSFNEVLEREVDQRTHELRRRAEQLQAMAREVTDAEQRERRRLAQLLHDDLQQLLVAARLRLSAARSDGEGDVAQIIAEAEDLIGQSIDTSRSLSTELAPPALYNLGLPGALRWLAGWCQQQWRLEVEAHCDEAASPPDQRLQVLIFSAVRELLLNVVKHAHTGRAEVRLGIDNGQLRCVVQDWGQGFDVARARDSQGNAGFGLFSIQQRLELLGGRVHVDSAPGNGTRVQLTAPMNAPRE